MQKFKMKDLIDFGVRFLTSKGVPEKNAQYISKSIVDTEAFRQSTHGIVRFNTINKCLGNTITPDKEPEVVKEFGATAIISGKDCFGSLAVKLGCEKAVENAKKFGVGYSGVRSTSWIGALNTYLIPIAEQGFLASASSQTNKCKDCAPIGGIDCRFSTNPYCIAFPTETDPVVADFSTAAMSMGSAKSMISEGKKTEIPRFLDIDGNLTCDPNVMNNNGSILFSGGEQEGHKFYGMSLFSEALTILSGGSGNTEDEAIPNFQSFAITVINPEIAEDKDYYLKEMHRYLDYLKSSRVRSDYDEIRLPGERGFKALKDCQENGLPLSDSNVEMLQGIADECGIEFI
ncbi:MAG: Ldh family oxidoreductase [Planctomycetota bacterium]|jgi:LDH2 family malate/lactate/ureidoglycolate dehydrogenase